MAPPKNEDTGRVLPWEIDEARSFGTVAWRMSRQLFLFLALSIFSVTIQALQYPPTIILAFSRTAYRRAQIEIQKLFGVLLAMISWVLAPGELVVKVERDVWEDMKQKGGKAVIMANHQMYADWWYLWILGYNAGHHGDFKIMLKASLRWIPVLGWGMTFFEFIFLHRKWASDSAVLKKHLERIVGDGLPVWLLIFPEGTVMVKNTVDGSKEWAQAQGQPYPFQNVLFPRSTGLFFTMRNLPQEDCPYLYDFTIGYPGTSTIGGECTYVANGRQLPYFKYHLSNTFINGNGPKEIHVLIRRFATKVVPGIGERGVTLPWEDQPSAEESTSSSFDPLLDVSSGKSAGKDSAAILRKRLNAHGNISTFIIESESSSKSSVTENSAINTPSSSTDNVKLGRQSWAVYSLDRSAPTEDLSTGIKPPVKVSSSQEPFTDPDESERYEAFTNWLRDRFLEKDVIMDQFWIRGKFQDGDVYLGDRRHTKRVCTAFQSGYASEIPDGTGCKVIFRHLPFDEKESKRLDDILELRFPLRPRLLDLLLLVTLSIFEFLLSFWVVRTMAPWLTVLNVIQATAFVTFIATITLVAAGVIKFR
ncbi:acyltransferase-domain-containing protein [Gonapodya prolifera JEL478]|uniref:Acyltransferase-domain-containing protein n=1 Tax=Gonapodya prolifera (strain JEL478) TaxID=1344416 RepID=A0A139AXX2_GONPJ|nr:acyltransferase-domain-containing protein [Gonapodya prolifera JEL478]|eukprot:KXS21554.1 acyltransferase-domain-containing protein [Gonapodya prolifera JEL478]